MQAINMVVLSLFFLVIDNIWLTSFITRSFYFKIFFLF